MGDKNRLKQVLTNLLSNAVKFTQQGEVILTVQYAQGMMKISVRDTGIGIPENKRTLLFDAFSQIDSSHSRKFGGTGLGLTISKRLVQAMGGDIHVLSTEGEGSEFSFSLPMIRSEQAVHVHAEHNINLEQCRVAVVSNNATLSDTLYSKLCSFGMHQLYRLEVSRFLSDRLRHIQQDKRPLILILDGGSIRESHNIQIFNAINLNALNVRLLLIECLQKEQNSLPADLVIYSPIRNQELKSALWQLESGERIVPDVLDEQPRVLTGLRVLVAEDNPVNQDVAVAVLSDMGVQVTLANNGQEAVQKVQQSDFDLVFMDIHMPEMDGLEATRCIRQLGGNYSQLPIIAMTANALAGDDQVSLQAGMNDHLIKPIDPQLIWKALHRWCRAEQSKPTKPTADHSHKASEGLLTEPLPGLDIVEGIKRVGSQALYLTILTTFKQAFTDTSTQVATMLRQEDWSALRHLAHALKGSCANIGAMGASYSAAVLEQALVNKDIAQVAQLAEQVNIRLSELLRSIEQVLALQEMQTNAATESQVTIDPDRLRHDIMALVPLLESDYGEVMKRTDELLQQDTGHNDKIKEIYSVLANFDYDKSRQALKAFIQQLENLN